MTLAEKEPDSPETGRRAASSASSAAPLVEHVAAEPDVPGEQAH